MTREQHRRRIASDHRRRARNVAAGLRTDGKPRVKRKPCGCLYGSCLKCRPANKLFVPAAVVSAMAADYAQGMSLTEVGRRHPRKDGPRSYNDVREVLKRRGVEIRYSKTKDYARGTNGRLLPLPRKTAKELAALIEKGRWISCPGELKQEWREWPMSRRRQFLRQFRASLRRRGLLDEPPRTPISNNVERFEYGSRNVVAMAKRLNVGHSSQTMPIKVKPASLGLIWRGVLYFWSGEGSGYTLGPWRPGIGRPALHHDVWAQHNGRKVPPKTTVIFKDGNKNNFDPANLELRTMADCARYNSVWGQQKRNPNCPRIQALVDKVSNRVTARWAKTSRNKISALLKNQTKAPHEQRINPAALRR